MVAVRPAIVSVPRRPAPVSFLRTENLTTPFPVPLAPVSIVIHASLLVAVHAQMPAVVTATLWPPPPFGSIPWVSGEMVDGHPVGGDGGGGGAPAAI
jgi:hypothetical protein